MAGGVIPPVVLELRAKIDEFQTKMGEARGEVEKLSKQGADNMAKLEAVGKGAFLGLAAAAVGFGAMSVKAAVDQEAANARLTTALANAGSAMTAQSEEVEELEARMRKLGFVNVDTADGLEKLTNATHDPEKAMRDMALAADIARGRHIDLATATDILSKVETGHVALLGRIGINTKDATGATISQEEAVKRLSEMYGGQASAYAGTFQGKMAELKAQVENVQEQVGLFLIPKIEQLVSVGAGAIKWAEDHKTAAELLAAVIGGPLVVAMGAYVAIQTKAFALKIAELLGAGADMAAKFAGSLITVTESEGMATIGLSNLGAGLIGIGGGLATAIYLLDRTAAAANRMAQNIEAAAGSDVQAQIDALKQKKEELDAKFENVPHVGFIWLTDGAAHAKTESEKLGQEIDRLQARLQGQSKDMQDGKTAADDLSGSVDGLATKAPKAIKTFSDAVAVLRDNLSDAADKAKAFKMAVDTLIGAPISKEQAQIKFMDASQSLGDALSKNGSDFNLTSGAGRANRTALESAIGAARDQLSAMQSSGASNPDLQAAFNQQRSSLLNTIRHYGFGATDANNILAQEGFAPGDFAALMNAASPAFLAGQQGSAAAAAAMRAYPGLISSGALARLPTPGTMEGFMGPVANREARMGVPVVGDITLTMNGQVVAKLTQQELLRNARNAAAIGLS